MKPSYEYVSLHPARLNLLDMINSVGRASIPATLFYDIDMAWWEAIKRRFVDAGHKVTVTAVLIKAIAIAQKNHPKTRTQMLPIGGLVQFNMVRAQFTVERFIDGEPALFFGDIEDPDTKSLQNISAELQAYGNEPIEKIPQLEIQNRFSRYPWILRQLIIYFGIRIPAMRLRYMGATFGLSSLGKYGCRNLISPSVITSMFCVGEVEDRPMARDGKVEVRPQLSLVLNFDHRVMDGATAARFMKEIIELLQGGLEAHMTEELAYLQSASTDHQ